MNKFASTVGESAAPRRASENFRASTISGAGEIRSMTMDISKVAFDQIRDYVYRTAGINIGADKSAMVVGRLWRRLEISKCVDYEAYLTFVSSAEGINERHYMLDLLTTNETYFFREPAHFDFLRHKIIQPVSRHKIKVWCGASSTGEEPYSLAMVLQEALGDHGWDLLATDISHTVLAHARAGIYRTERLDCMPEHYLKNFCLRGVNEFSGKMAIAKSLVSNVRFDHHNLLQPLATTEMFDVVFLRNVLIYFDQPTKQKVIEHILQRLRPGGWLIVGHCESIQGFKNEMSLVTPSIYRKLNATSTTSTSTAEASLA